MSVSPLRPWADLEVGVSLEAKIERAPHRARCSRCHVRRVLYRIIVENVRLTDAGVTEARCADCWGVRP